METKLTKEKKLEAYAMLLDGATYQEIADQLGVTKQLIWAALPHKSINPKTKAKRAETYAKIVFPAIRKWMQENELSVGGFGKMLEFSDFNIRHKLTGERYFRKPEIDRILAVTGMTYEEAFAEKTQEGEAHEGSQMPHAGAVQARDGADGSGN